MLRISVVAAALLASLSFAQAEQAAVLSAQTALATALDVAQENAATRWAYTIVYTNNSEEDAKTYKLRYDPRKQDGRQWALLEPSADTLSKKERKQLEKMQGEKQPDDGLVYDKLEVDLDQAVLTYEDFNTAVFDVPVTDEDMPEKMRNALKMTVSVDKAGAFVKEITVESTAPFKPAPIAKVNAFIQTQRYAPVSGDGPALLRETISRIDGKAMLQSINSDTHISYSDFEAVELDVTP